MRDGALDTWQGNSRRRPELAIPDRRYSCARQGRGRGGPRAPRRPFRPRLNTRYGNLRDRRRPGLLLRVAVAASRVRVRRPARHALVRGRPRQPGPALAGRAAVPWPTSATVPAPSSATTNCTSSRAPGESGRSGPRTRFRTCWTPRTGEALVDWLREWPMIHRDPERGFVMVHAGIAPAWTIDGCARPRGRAVTGPARTGPRAAPGGHVRQRARRVAGIPGPDSTGCASSPTPSRGCATAAAMAGSISPKPTRPACRTRRSCPGSSCATPGRTVPGIVFGHWATLQIDAALSRDLHVRHVDTGCVWGGSLTALRLEDDREFSVGCAGGASPAHQ